MIRYGGNLYDPHLYGINEIGAIEILTGSAQPTLSALSLTDNYAAIRVGNGSSPTIAGLTFARNTIGIRVQSGTPSITGNSFDSDANDVILDGGTTTVTGNTLTNVTLGVRGGAGAMGTISGNTITTVSGGKPILTDAAFLGSIGANTYSGAGLNALYVNGGQTLAANTTWSQTTVPYWIGCGDVTVAAGATLTIGPGVIVKLLNCGSNPSRLIISGSLVANGTAAQKIYFTSQKDDAVGGDTNGDGTATTPGQGDWSGLYFANGATGSS